MDGRKFKWYSSWVRAWREISFKSNGSLGPVITYWIRTTSMSQSFTTQDNIEIRGAWWLPNNPDRKIPGVLKCAPDSSINLSLDSSIVERGIKDHELIQPGVIFGCSTERMAVSLIQARETTFTMDGFGVRNSVFSAEAMMHGREHVNPDRDRFESCLLELTGLSTWLNRSSFRDDDEKDFSVFRTVYTKPKIDAFYVRSVEASIGFDCIFNRQPGWSYRELRHTDFIRIRPRRKEPLDWYITMVRQLCSLLSLFLWQPVQLIRMQLALRRRRVNALGGRYIREYADFIPWYSPKTASDELFPAAVPFLYDRLRQQWRDILAKWFSKDQSIEIAASLLVGDMINRGTPAEYRFLGLIQALEALQRSLGGGFYLPEDDYCQIRQALVSAIPAGTPSDLCDALKSRIKYGNEFALRKRLALLLDRAPPPVIAAITRNAKQFVKRVSDTRNYLTHRDTKPGKTVMQFHDLDAATNCLRVLLWVHILQELGLSGDFIADVMLKSWWVKTQLKPL